MAREKIGSDLMQVRFPDGTFERIAATGISRPRFIRDAVEAALSGGPAAPLNPAYADVDPAALLPKVVPAAKAVPQKKNSIVRPPELDDPIVSPDDPRMIDPPTKRDPAPTGRQADAAAVLAVIRSKPMSSRQVEAAMGWLGLRYSNAEKLLLRSGAVAVVDGHLVAT